MRTKKIYAMMLITALLATEAEAQIKVETNGFVGVGTVSPKESFQIGNTLTFHDGGSKAFAYNFHYDGGLDKRLIAGEAKAMYINPVGAIEFRFANSGAAGSIISWSATPLRIYNNGIAINHSYTGSYWKLVVGGPAYCYSGVWTASDKDLKENI